MGKGKGKFKGWIGYVVPGRLLYDMGFVTTNAIQASPDIKNIYSEKLPFEKIRLKFPFKINVFRRHYKFNENDKYFN